MDISEQISSLLNSPEGMDKLRSAAASLLGGQHTEPDVQKEQSAPPGHGLPEGIFDNIGNISSVMKVMSLLQNKKEDDRVRLLLALKPHLSNERAQRVDRAVSLLKIASILPILKEEGIIDGLFSGGIL